MQTQQLNLLDQSATNANLIVNLLESDEAEVTAASVAKPSLNELFTRYQAMSRAIEDLTRKQQEFEQEHFGRQITDTPSLQGIRRVAERALSALVHHAEAQFAPVGTNLSISQSEALIRTGQDNWRDEYERNWDKYRISKRTATVFDEAPMTLDLDKLWSDLEQTFGGNAGIEEGYRQQAKKIIDFFGLNRDDDVNKTKNAVILKARIWSEKKDYGPNKGMFEPHSNCRSRIVEIFSALRCFAERDGLEALADYLHTDHPIAGYGFYFNPREKIAFPGMEIALFKDKFEFRFTHAVAEKLMMFLSEYASV